MMRIVSAVTVATLMMLSVVVAQHATAPRASAAVPVNCLANGLVVNTVTGNPNSVLSRVDVSTGTAVFTPIGQMVGQVNALGYNTRDGFLYAVNNASQFIRFGEDAGAGQVNLGQSQLNGAPLLAADWSFQFFNAAVTAQGVHIMLAKKSGVGGTNHLIRTDLMSSPLTTTTVALTGPFTGTLGDMAFNPYDGLLYAPNGGSIYTIDPITGVTALVTGVTGTVPLGLGAAWTDSLSNIYFWQAPDIFRYDPVTKVIASVAQAVAVPGFDGTACLPPALGKTVSPESAKIGEELTFTFALGNATPGPLTAVDFSDQLPAGSGLQWVSAGVTPANPGGGTVTIAGGSLTIDQLIIPNPSSGLVTFTARAEVVSDPVTPGVFNNTATIKYNGTTVLSDNPALNGNADPTPFNVFIAPTAVDDAAATSQDVTVAASVLANDTGNGSTLDPTTVRLVDSGGALVSTLAVSGEGTYTVDAVTGAVEFDPVPTFSGATTPITYSVSDRNGNRGSARLAVTVTAAPPPSATDDAQSTPYNTSVTVDALANDAPGAANTSFDPTSVRLVDADGNPVTTLTIASQGTYTVAAATGAITFTPLASFTGVATPVTYRVNTTFGATASAEVTITVGAPADPTMVNDSVTVASGMEAVLTPLSNDTAGPPGTSFVTSSLRLINPNTGLPVTTVIVAGQGTWSVDPTVGEVIFSPVPGYSGTPVPLAYRVTRNSGDSFTATLSVTVLPAPVAAPDSAIVPFGVTAIIDVLANDTVRTGSAKAVQLVDSAGQPAASVSLPGVGVFTLNLDGTVAFAPASGYSGTATVPYRLTDDDGITSDSTITVTVGAAPVATPDTVSTTPGKPVVINPLANDTPGLAAFDLTAVRLLAPDGSAVTDLSLPGQGTVTVDVATGLITFTPVDGFIGVASFGYQVADINGVVARSSVVVTVQSGGGGSPPSSSPPSPGGLAVTGSDGIWIAVGAAISTVLLGLAIMLAARRRSTDS
ncbi:MAG: Ig-like domain-containing protein [Rhodoglobus sp.]